MFELFLIFFKIGLFSFGGGYAMISLLQQEVQQWMTVSEFTDIVAISQITPGPIAVNLATFVGFRTYGFLGSLVATLGVCLPAIILVLILVRYVIKFNHSNLVRNIFFGIKPAVTGLILAAVIQIAGLEFFNTEYAGILSAFKLRSLFIFALALSGMIFFKLKPIPLIIGSALAGMLLMTG